jgi:hypothetical protein
MIGSIPSTAMERVEGARTPFEVYCFHCRVTFPAEARRCLHCGGPLSARGERADVQPQPVPGLGLPIPDGEDAEEGPVMMARRVGGLAIWALVALSAVLSHLCQQPG